jgi:hypothetical protein
MKCASGQHEWISPVNAKRCCNPRWQRILVPLSEASKYDLNGQQRVDGEEMVHVWQETQDGGFTKPV